MALVFRECQFLACAQRALDVVVALSLGDFGDRTDCFLEKRDGREFNGAKRRITGIESASLVGWMVGYRSC